MNTIEIEFAHPTGDYQVGQRVTLPEEDAKRFIRAAVARPTKDADADPADSETAAPKKR